MGIVCTMGNRDNGNPIFTLSTRTGYILLPDGNTMFMWGYSEGGKPFQHPSPVLCVNQGDTVTVVLQNTLNEDVSIIFPGQENVLANGVPAQPQFDGSGNVTSLTNVATAGGGSITYRFVAGNPGTYLYESGTAGQKQVRMGLFGALIVRPTMRRTLPITEGTASSHPPRSSWCCSPKSIPIYIRRSRPVRIST
ncbi:MAG: multicopper oxidase domain-containing protein [Caldilineaceae bacterium]